jgi:hypothetical protein
VYELVLAGQLTLREAQELLRRWQDEHPDHPAVTMT